VLAVGPGGVPCGGAVGSAVHTLRRAEAGAPVPLRLQRVCGLLVVSF
jgi:hypothetical protein